VNDASSLLEPLQRQWQRLIRQWQRLPLLDRWLASELVGPLLFGIAAFTAVSLSVGVVFELVRKVAEAGLPVVDAAQVLFLRLPGFLVLSFPMATLMATLLAFSRLSGSSELTALRSLGVKTLRIVLPALVVSALMSVLTFAFNDYLVPISNRVASDKLDASLGRAISSRTGKDVVFSQFGRILKRDASAPADEGLTHVFHAREFTNGEMNNVSLLDLSKEGQHQILISKKAVWSDSKGLWRFVDGRITVVDTESGLTTSADFDNYYYPFSRAPVDIAALPKDAAQMTVGQALRAERLLRLSGDDKEARRLRVRIQEKFAFPAICLVFGLIGSSLGVRPNARTSRSQGFGISVLLIFGYYLMSFIFSSLGIKGTVMPFFAAWMPVIIGLGGGLVLLRQASR
jgi:lipopolysaccharide export system permease protein